VLDLNTEENVAKMRADISQLEHPKLIASPPTPLQSPDSVVDRQGVCTLCWIVPNTDIVAVLGTECCFMFVYNGMLCTLSRNAYLAELLRADEGEEEMTLEWTYV
jgi:hypothetical protein